MPREDLLIIDQLYGTVVIPSWLRPVVLSPELQRLREVRLINTTSPSCGSLSDARRFTHTLGVLNLALRLSSKLLDSWSVSEYRAFLVAALLHDIGTPAFGHLFEYQLAAIKGWNHEQFVLDIIKGTYDKTKIYHQIFYNNPLKLHGILKNMDIDVELVANLVTGRNTLGELLAGSLDLDNIDNVFRMAVLLGLHQDPSTPMQLIDQIIPTKNGIVYRNEVLPILDTWRQLRRGAYELLAFDEYCLSGQAMLTDCLTIALTQNNMDASNWYFTDEQLVREFLEIPETKKIAQRFAVADYYEQVFLGWYAKPKGAIDLRHPIERARFIDLVEARLKVRCSPYVFYDSGTFSKRLKLDIQYPTGIRECVVGEHSQSTIVSIHSPVSLSDSAKKRFQSGIVKLLEEYGLPQNELKEIPRKQDVFKIPVQQEIPF